MTICMEQLLKSLLIMIPLPMFLQQQSLMQKVKLITVVQLSSEAEKIRTQIVSQEVGSRGSRPP